MNRECRGCLFYLCLGVSDEPAGLHILITYDTFSEKSLGGFLMIQYVTIRACDCL